MIRFFERTDIRRIKSNAYSGVGDLAFVFEDDSFYKFTLVGNDDRVYAIICFKKYWKNNAIAFFLISEDMPLICARELKEFVHNAVKDMGGERVQTDSVADPTIDRWHKFLGFTLEGRRDKMINDKDYHLWGFLKGRDF